MAIIENIDYELEMKKEPQKHQPTENYIMFVLPIVLSDQPAEIKRSLAEQAIKKFFPK